MASTLGISISVSVNGTSEVIGITHEWHNPPAEDQGKKEIRAYQAATRAMLVNIGMQFGPEMAESIFMDAIHEIAKGAVGWEAAEAPAVDRSGKTCPDKNSCEYPGCSCL